MKKNTDLIFQHLLWRGLYFLSVLLINIGVARFLGAEKSGQIFYIINGLALILLISGISLESGAAYYIASGKLEPTPMAWFCAVWATGASLFALLVWCVILYFSHSHLLSDPAFILSSFLFILGVQFTTYFTALFYAKKEFGLPNKILTGVNVILLLLLILLRRSAIIQNSFLQIYFAAFFLQGWLLRMFFFRKYKSENISRFPSRSILRQVIRYSLAALLANSIYFLVNRADYWFVQYFCSANDLGNYIQASKLAQMLLVLPAILGSTLFPIFSSGKISGADPRLTASMRILFWINGSICLLMLSTGWYFIPLIFGSSFGHMYILFILLIPGILSVTLNYPMAAWFSASRRIGINIRGSIVALLVICACDFILLPRYGILFAPVVASLGYFSYFMYTMYTYRRECKISWKKFLILRKSDIDLIRQSAGLDNPETAVENPIV
jgi:O-antigen/teichoic acid export membrane protein